MIHSDSSEGTFLRIVYVDTRSLDCGPLPDDIKFLRDFTWRQTAFVRWSQILPEAVSTTAPNVSLFVLDWSQRNASVARKARREIRRLRPGVPILIVSSDEGRTPGRTQVGPNEVFLASEDLHDTEQVTKALAALRVRFPQPRLWIQHDENDLLMSDFLSTIPISYVESTIQKYFPKATHASLRGVTGGFSGDPLCWVFVDGSENPNFLKFFRQSDDYRGEMRNHGEAKRWLDQAAVSICRIPEVDYSVEFGLEAFPPEPQARFPICYESASSLDAPRMTFRQLYLTESDEFVATVIATLLRVLARQPSVERRNEIPWSHTNGRGFVLDRDRLRTFASTLSDLSIYGPALCRDWRERHERLRGFVYSPRPPWLTDPRPVAVGRVHGDLNSRNYLVSKESPTDPHLIDCGTFRTDGRLIADLALIECDVKFALLGSELTSPKHTGSWGRLIRRLGRQSTLGNFMELDTTVLPLWCEAESRAIARLLQFNTSAAISEPHSSVRRAYHLVSLIRERAWQLSAPDDTDGCHYFAALLYWTIKILKFDGVRPTKKLLALYSISEILTTMQRRLSSVA